MSRLSKILIFVILILATLLVGMYFGSTMNLFEHKKEESSSVVLKGIEKVTKLITVEANVSEIYTFKDFNTYDWGILRKKALVRVNAKVSVGYDFNKMGINMNSETKKVTITNFPPPEILSIDHDLDYFDIEQGLFNSFDEADYNRINSEAKQMIRNSIKTLDILKQSEDHKNELIDMMSLMLKGMGYELVVNDSKQLN